MGNKQIIPASRHKLQITKYSRVLPRYKRYADVLRRVLERACKTSFPDAFVQSRPKSVSSFAEKAARRYDTYPDAVNQMTDLCGARVIVQTIEQVAAVKQFVEANFQICEQDEKGVLLGEDRFGYRDMHYIIQLKADRNSSIGITREEQKIIGDLKAEIQVRTWLQHAWADTLHDRLYKNPLQLSTEVRRTGNLLAALMEEGDRNYNNIAHELDGMIANYTAFATKKEVEKEIKIQRLILDNESDDNKKPGLAMKLARLYLACGHYKKVIKLLEPYLSVSGSVRCELLQDIGYAICKTHKSKPESKDYERGCQMLKKAVDLCSCKNWLHVPDVHRCESLYARSMVRLAWASGAIRRRRAEALEYYRQAHEHEPENPYYLSDMLGFEIYISHNLTLSNVMRTTLHKAITTCRNHAEAGIELPHAYFTAGRLCLLLEKPQDAIGYYARGIHYCLTGIHCVPSDILAYETDWVERLHQGIQPPDGHRWVLDLFALAEHARQRRDNPKCETPKVILLSGGAASLDESVAKAARPLIEQVLGSFEGIVISGGTTTGIPGCAGRTASVLAARKAKRFELIGYIPHQLPHDAVKDKRYDDIVVYGEISFSPDQIFQSWRDILDRGICPDEVLCLGFGGGPVSDVEYKVALALGARVVIAHGSKGSADAIISDTLWSGIANLVPVPMDKASFHALLTPSAADLEQEEILIMAQEFHLRYVAASADRLPANMRPWSKLDETFQKANLEQAGYAVKILETCGFETHRIKKPVIFKGFTDNDIERMAEMEHGRWNVERLRDGWRPGKTRDNLQKIHDCIVPWRDLPESIRHYDRDAVRAFPEILAKAGLEVYRKRS